MRKNIFCNIFFENLEEKYFIFYILYYSKTKIIYDIQNMMHKNYFHLFQNAVYIFYK